MEEPLVETVPNFSEGEDWDVIEHLVNAFKTTQDVAYLDLHLDEDHNRSVITAAGPASSVREALTKAVKEAVDRIDLSDHEGTHPFMGAADVIPLIPLEDATMEEATHQSEVLAERISEEFNLPTFLYANAARRDHTEKLANLRRHSLEEFDDKMKACDEWKPDFGPDRCHPTAGATAVGSRGFLIAMNVDILTEDVENAKDIARQIRESSGGLPGIQALGMELEEQGRITVSTNITDYEKTSPHELVQAIHEEARERDIKPGPTELVGLMPEAALNMGDPDQLNIPRFDPERHVFEQRFQARMGDRESV